MEPKCLSIYGMVISMRGQLNITLYDHDNMSGIVQYCNVLDLVGDVVRNGSLTEQSEVGINWHKALSHPWWPLPGYGNYQAHIAVLTYLLPAVALSTDV